MTARPSLVGGVVCPDGGAGVVDAHHLAGVDAVSRPSTA